MNRQAAGLVADGGGPFAASAATFLPLLQKAFTIPGIDERACAALAEKLAQHNFNLVVAGEFKRGKSTVINALLGTDLLPAGVVPLTSVVTLVSYGDTPGATVTFDDGETRAIALDALPDYVTEPGNPHNAKRVLHVAVDFPAAWLKGGIHLVDTPGIGSVHRHNTDVTYRYLPEADAVVFVASADQPVSGAELDFLVDIRRYAAKVFCLLNKVDYLTEVEQSQSLEFVTATLREALGAPVPVFAISARLALQGRTNNDPALLARSGLPAFSESLQRFLMDDGGAAWLASLSQHLLRLLAETRLAIELEVRGLSLPLQALEANLQAFTIRQRESLQANTDLDALLDADTRRLIKDRMEPDLEEFKNALVARLETALGGWYEELRAQGSNALRTGLEQRLVLEVRREFDAWRAREEVAVGTVFDSICGRFWRRIQDTVDELLRYSAELFAIPFVGVPTESLWQSSSGFYYKFWQEPPGLMLLTNSLIRILPGFLGHPLILRQAQQRAAELADMQSGRLRYDLEERIKQSLQIFRRDIRERMDTTVAAIESAIEKGRTLRLAGEGATTARRHELGAALIAIQALESRLKTNA